jgi:hypothetical protein
MERKIAEGVDGIITNYPGRLTGVIDRVSSQKIEVRSWEWTEKRGF